jgi:ribosomal protein S18 acetylase RimI-like enzyme
MDIRVLRPSDIPHVQLANITNLPENYFCKYYLYHAMSWPQLSYVAVDVSFVSCDSGGLMRVACLLASHWGIGKQVEWGMKRVERGLVKREKG